jgi:hypothetical protein
MNASNIDPFTLPSLSLNKVLANLTVQLPKRVVESRRVLCIGKILSLAHFQGCVSKIGGDNNYTKSFSKKIYSQKLPLIIP